MSILPGLLSTLAVALVFSGVDKVFRPSGAARALLTARLVPGPAAARPRTSRVLGRSLGVAEVVVGVGAAVVLLASSSAVPARASAPALVAVVYLGFAWFLRRVGTISPGASCGCFGSGSTAGPLHLTANLVAATVAGGSALATLIGRGEPSLRAELNDPLVAIPFGVVVVIGALLFLLVPSLLGELGQARRGAGSRVATFSISEPIGR